MIITLGGTYQHKATRKSAISLQKKIARSPSRFEWLLEHVNCIQYHTGRWLGLNGFEIPEEIDNNYMFTNKNTHVDLVNEMSERCISFIYEN